MQVAGSKPDKKQQWGHTSKICVRCFWVHPNFGGRSLGSWKCKTAAFYIGMSTPRVIYSQSSKQPLVAHIARLAYAALQDLLLGICGILAQASQKVLA